MNIWQHQQEAISRAKDLNYFGLFMEPGLGKTLTAIRILEDKFEKENRYLRTLILAPIVVLETWKREFIRFSSIRSNQIIILSGSTGDRAYQYNNNKYPCVFISNYESIYSQAFYNALLLNPPEVIIADELHRLKSTKAKRTKRCLELSKLAKYRFGLTGTPVLNSALDLYSQISFLDGYRTFGKSFWIYRAQYFDDKNRARAGTQNYFPNFVLRPGKEVELKEKIAPFTIVTKKEDALDLPDLVRQVQYVELTDEQKKCYKQMKKDLIAIFNDKACTASIALVKSLRLQQIVSGFIKFEDGTVQRFDATPRLNALKDLLEEICPTHKCIVWTVFKENYEMIKGVCDELKLPYAEIHGEITDKDSQVQAFNSDPTIRVMIAHPGAGGIGINLIPASYSIWYSRNFSLEHDVQATARNYRGGSEIHEKIIRIDLVSKGTVDELVMEAIREKAANSEKLLTNNDLFKTIKDGLQNE